MISFQDWKEQAKSFQYKGHSIAYWEGGQGTPLLLIHGFPTSSWDWHKTWESLCQRYKVYAPDMIGFGYSDKPRRYKYSITDQARLHEAFADHLGIKEAHLFVHDYGVSVAQEMLATFKERGNQGLQILSCCFLNGGLFPELHRARPIQKLMNSPIGFLFSPLLSKSNLRRSFHKVYGEKKATEEELDQFYQLILHNGGKSITHKLIGYINDRKENATRWKAALLEAEIPIKIINGPLDPVSGQHLAEYCRQLLPKLNITILEGVGHYPHDEAPEEVLEAYFEFMDTVK
jgi:pimeloyl-ACP methyl ester carboxylesterase